MVKLKLAIRKEPERGDFSDNGPLPSSVPFDTPEALFREKLDSLTDCGSSFVRKADFRALAS